MAGVDKTYVTLEQYKIVRKWWLETKDQQVDELGHAIWLAPLWVYAPVDLNYYERAEDIPDSEINKEKDFKQWEENPNQGLVLWNTSVKEDLWLSLNCNIDFIQERLKEQYEEWIGFTHRGKLDIKDQPFIAEIRLSDDNPIYFFKEYDDGTSEPIEEILFYGTTFLPKIFNQAIQTLYIGVEVSDIKYIIFNYYGVIVKYDQKQYIDVDTEQEVYLAVDSSELLKPTFIHSYDLNDTDRYEDEQIFMSHENEAFDITQYKDFSKDQLNRYIGFLPNYISELIPNK